MLSALPLLLATSTLNRTRNFIFMYDSNIV